MKTSTLAKSIVSTKDVIGVNVQNSEKENLGKIEEIVLEKTSGKVHYLILSFGGFLGMGDKLFAIPWNAIHYDPKEDVFVLNIDKEKLKNAPGFDKNKHPDFAEKSWSDAIYNFYRDNFSDSKLT